MCMSNPAQAPAFCRQRQYVECHEALCNRLSYGGDLLLFGKISNQWSFSTKFDSTYQLYGRIQMLSEYFATHRREPVQRHYLEWRWYRHSWSRHELSKRSSEEQYYHTDSDWGEPVGCSNPVQCYYRNSTGSDNWWKCYSHHLWYCSVVVLYLPMLLCNAGLPEAPSNLTSTQSSSNALILSWSAPSSPVQLHYTITVNITSTTIAMFNTSSITITISREDLMTINSTECDLYTFSVTAINPAGSSIPANLTGPFVPGMLSINWGQKWSPLLFSRSWICSVQCVCV